MSLSSFRRLKPAYLFFGHQCPAQIKQKGWNDRPMSRAGKEIMLKSVAQAIPTYVMSCFRLPDSICENLRATISNHWWGFEGGKKKMHWRSWDWLTTPKFLGGSLKGDIIQSVPLWIQVSQDHVLLHGEA